MIKSLITDGKKHLSKLIQELSEKRSFFFSEADFQHELAWLIRSKTDCAIYLERPMKTKEEPYPFYVDIILVLNQITIGIELKYKTKKESIDFAGEPWVLGNQAATNLGRYDYIKDIIRLEKLKIDNKIEKGYSIFLSNDSSYWNDNRKYNKTGVEFYISENMTISNELKWSQFTNMGGIGKRKNPLQLLNTYKMNWLDYSNDNRNNFKFLVTEI